ncbi:MAG: MBL fold metallo-hydrolase [Methyloligellaceae bacterium]
MEAENRDHLSADSSCIVPTGRTKTRFQETPLYPEGLYDLGNGIYAWMVPNGSWGESNAGLVVGKDSSLLIDTLWDHNYTQQMLDAMKTVTETAPIKTLFNTHADGDHFWGNHLLKDIDIIASEASMNDMNHHKPVQMALFKKVGQFFSMLPMKKYRRAGHWMKSMVQPYKFGEVIHTPAKRGFNDRMTLDVGGRDVELIEVGPAHRPGDAMAYIPDSKILFTADILFINCTPVMWKGPVENWIKALDLILEMDVGKIVPGHGPITDKAGVQKVKDYWIFVSKQARQKFEAGVKPADAAYQIAESQAFTSSIYMGWDSPERLMTNCHTLYRNFQSNMKPMSRMEIIGMMANQAGLANQLSDATPQCMRLK